MWLSVCVCSHISKIILMILCHLCCNNGINLSKAVILIECFEMDDFWIFWILENIFIYKEVPATLPAAIPPLNLDSFQETVLGFLVKMYIFSLWQNVLFTTCLIFRHSRFLILFKFFTFWKKKKSENFNILHQKIFKILWFEVDRGKY